MYICFLFIIIFFFLFFFWFIIFSWMLIRFITKDHLGVKKKSSGAQFIPEFLCYLVVDRCFEKIERNGCLFANDRNEIKGKRGILGIRSWKLLGKWLFRKTKGQTVSKINKKKEKKRDRDSML